MSMTPIMRLSRHVQSMYWQSYSSYVCTTLSLRLVPSRVVYADEHCDDDDDDDSDDDDADDDDEDDDHDCCHGSYQHVYWYWSSYGH